MDGEFSGQTAVVTGAGSGIGKATAIRLGNYGATVVCTDIVGEEQTAQEIRSEGGRATPAKLDVRDGSAWADLVRRTVGENGGVDILVNNAGIAVPGDTVVDASEDLWDSVMSINAKGVWLGMKHVIPVMLERGRARSATSPRPPRISGCAMPRLTAHRRARSSRLLGRPASNTRRKTSRSIRCRPARR